jgi:hypothetical protein
MGIQNLLQRYSLDVRARGGSEETIQHTTMVMKFFADFMGGVDDVTELVDDDLKRFIVYLRQKKKWSGLPHAKDEKLGGRSAPPRYSYTNKRLRGYSLLTTNLSFDGFLEHSFFNT